MSTHANRKLAVHQHDVEQWVYQSATTLMQVKGFNGMVDQFIFDSDDGVM